MTRQTHRQHLMYVSALTLALAMFAGCKPSEKHYREVYETTVNARHAGEDEYLDSVARAAMQTGGRPVIAHIGDSVLQYRVEWIRPADGESGRPVKHNTSPAVSTPGRNTPSPKPYCIIRDNLNSGLMQERCVAAFKDMVIPMQWCFKAPNPDIL